MNKTAIIYSKEESRAMPPEKRPICHRVSSKIYHAAFEAAGHASLCWEPKPTGVFATEEASNAVLNLLFVVAEELERLGVTFDQLNGPKMPTTDILIVSCQKHFPWLRYALKSIERFATGFRQVKVLIPTEDLTAINTILAEFSNHGGIPIRVQCFEDWPGKGFLRHEHIIMCSDEYTDAEFIYHMDSDCLFVEPTSPEDYIVDGKPVLLYASYAWLITQQANLGMWKDGVEKAIGGTSINEFMRRPQIVHHRKTYAKARECIEAHTMKPVADYIWSCENAFPQTFGEFNTLGEVAWRHFREDYCWKNQEAGEFPKPHKVVQWWSHSPPDQPQSPIYKDKPWTGTPEELLRII